jgi:ParB family chromosome partitioning protein
MQMNEMMMTDDSSKKKLGRGLSALLGENGASDYADLDRVRSAKDVPVEQLHANRYQPRQDWDQEALENLAESIAEKGILQPILVRRHPDRDGDFEIIAGERRWRAAQIAQLHQVPVVIKDLSDAESMEIAIIENIQREDLSPIEEAEAYRRLMNEFDYTQEMLSKKVGKSRSHLANNLRLLTLPPAVQAMIRDGRLSAGAARAVIKADDPEALALKIVEDGLSVRAAEELGRAPKEKKRASGGGSPRAPWKSADVLALEDDLSAAIGMKVSINHKNDGNGSLTITYDDLDQLDEACRRLTREPLQFFEEEDPIENEYTDPSQFPRVEIYDPEIKSALDDALEDPEDDED